MKLIIGIGNPGEKYKGNRHNVGWLVLDELKQEISKSEFLISNQTLNPNFQFQKKFQSEIVKLGNLILAKPQTMMNSSGKAVRKLVDHYKIKMPNLWVIHDDLDLRLGNYKIQKGKGPREHKGLLSIYEALRTKDFWHVRVGVDNRDKDSRTAGEAYVLQDFLPEEQKIVNEVIKKIVDGLISTSFSKQA